MPRTEEEKKENVSSITDEYIRYLPSSCTIPTIKTL